MKKKRGRIELLEAYSDESGNSGLNIFDEGQPWFWTGTLIGPGDVQSAAGPRILEFCRGLGVTELHGKILGLSRIEVIAEDLVRPRRISLNWLAFPTHSLTTKTDLDLPNSLSKSGSGGWVGAFGPRARARLEIGPLRDAVPMGPRSAARSCVAWTRQPGSAAPADWTLRSVRAIAYAMAGHERHHLADIRRHGG